MSRKPSSDRCAASANSQAPIPPTGMSQPYLSLEAELHDAFWDAEDDGSEVRLMAEFLKKHPGPALEVGSGSGRLMFPLLKRDSRSRDWNSRRTCRRSAGPRGTTRSEADRSHRRHDLLAAAAAMPRCWHRHSPCNSQPIRKPHCAIGTGCWKTTAASISRCSCPMRNYWETCRKTNGIPITRPPCPTVAKDC